MEDYKLSIIAPDDFHHHFRDENDSDCGLGMLSLTCKSAGRQFNRVIVMPNTKPPIRTTDEALLYKQRILHSLATIEDKNITFQPLMTLYLTDNTKPEEIFKAKKSQSVYAVKLYPAGATTNSELGVTSIDKIHDTLHAMSEVGMPLLVHGEVTDQDIDVFDREKIFIETVLKKIIQTHPDLKIVMEHITTEDAVEFVKSSGPNVAATITAHHLLYNRNAIFTGGVCPHMYCLPILKREKHRLALLNAATSGNSKFFLGTDSAPHSILNKETACGCAGIFTGHAAMELYAEAFHSVGAIDKLEAFASINGAKFYNLELCTDKRIVLQMKKWNVPEYYEFYSIDGIRSDDPSNSQNVKNYRVVPLCAGKEINWTMHKA